MNYNQRASNRRTARDLERHVRAVKNAQHTCENCGGKGGHWVTTRGVSLAGLIAGCDDSEGYWTCQPVSTDGDGVPRGLADAWIRQITASTDSGEG